MTINIPCWTTSKEEADKLVDELSEACYEYGKDESKEKMLDVFYKTKALKNYVGIMQGRIELLNARIAELEEERRWIPVSEPPKKSDWYLKMYDGYRIPDEDYYDIETGWVSGNIPDFWMPLPEPPEVKE